MKAEFDAMAAAYRQANRLSPDAPVYAVLGSDLNTAFKVEDERLPSR